MLDELQLEGPDVQDSAPVIAINRAIKDGRLAHALLLYGEDLEVLKEVATGLATNLLGKHPDKHPDGYTLTPAGKMRQIKIGESKDETNTVRWLIGNLYVTSSSGKKVAIVHEVDRMNVNSANAFLKSLEEPPENTTLLLLTTRPNDVLATIRSRCLLFRIPTGMTNIQDADWREWLDDYSHWLEPLASGTRPGKPADVVMPIYGLITRMSSLLKRMTDEQWKAEKEKLPDNLSDEQVDALQSGLQKGLRRQLLGELERRTRDVIMQDPAKPLCNPSKLKEAIQVLESSTGLLEVNFNADAALERFFLTSLRIWTRA